MYIDRLTRGHAGGGDVGGDDDVMMTIHGLHGHGRHHGSTTNPLKPYPFCLAPRVWVVQPENMMLTASGHVKLIDFGTCKDLRETNLNGGEFVGTAQYMSPQAVASEEQVMVCYVVASIGLLVGLIFRFSDWSVCWPWPARSR